MAQSLSPGRLNALQRSGYGRDLHSYLSSHGKRGTVYSRSVPHGEKMPNNISPDKKSIMQRAYSKMSYGLSVTYTMLLLMSYCSLNREHLSNIPVPSAALSPTGPSCTGLYISLPHKGQSEGGCPNLTRVCPMGERTPTLALHKIDQYVAMYRPGGA